MLVGQALYDSIERFICVLGVATQASVKQNRRETSSRTSAICASSHQDTTEETYVLHSALARISVEIYSEQIQLIRNSSESIQKSFQSRLMQIGRKSIRLKSRL